MSEPRQISISVHRWSQSFFKPAAEFISELTDVLETVPEEFRAGAMIAFNRTEEDDWPTTGDMEITYFRPENDGERRLREERQKHWDDEKEAQERKAFAALKAKYGEAS